jgi:hypothetical protein
MGRGGRIPIQAAWTTWVARTRGRHRTRRVDPGHRKRLELEEGVVVVAAVVVEVVADQDGRERLGAAWALVGTETAPWDQG